MSILPRRAERIRVALDLRLSSVVGIVEAVHRRHNASAILRSCEGFGVHEVHMVTGSFRPSKGAARGAERWVELHRHHEIGPCIEGLRARGFSIYVADLAESAFTPETLPVERPLAVLFGAEFSGVSTEAKALADGAVIVPMHGLTASLNVSAAAACILSRVTDRRRALLGGRGDLDEARRQRFYQEWLAREEAAHQGMAARMRMDD